MQTDLSNHAFKRIKQRSIPPVFIDLLESFGQPRPVGDGCTSYSLCKRGWRRAEAYLGPSAKEFGKLKNAYVVIARDGTVVTIAWRS